MQPFFLRVQIIHDASGLFPRKDAKAKRVFLPFQKLLRSSEAICGKHLGILFDCLLRPNPDQSAKSFFPYLKQLRDSAGNLFTRPAELPTYRNQPGFSILLILS